MIEPTPFVIDGDTTFSAEQGRRRLAGINTPEIAHGDAGFEMAGGADAAQRLTQLLKENPTAIWESQGRDTYGRDLGRYVTEDGIDLNEKLVREGYAAALDFDGQRSPYHQAESDYVRDLQEGRAEYVNTGTFSPPSQEEDLSLTQEFGEAVKRGTDQTQAMLGYGMSALARQFGLDSIAEYGEKIAVKNFEESMQHMPSIGSYTEIEDVEDFAKYAVGLIGENVPQIGFDLIAAAGTGGLGVLGKAAVKQGINKGIAGLVAKATSKGSFDKGLYSSTALQQIGEVEAELTRNGIDSPSTSIAMGLGMGVVDFVAAKALLNTASDFYKSGRNLQGMEVLKKGFRNTALEGSTEGLQEVMVKSANLFHNANYDLFSDENVEDTLNAVFAGAIVGSAPSAAAGAAKKLMNISKRNKSALGLTGTQSPDSKVVTTEYTDADGNVGRVAQESALDSEVDDVTKKHQEKAKNAGFEETQTRVESPQEVIKTREGEATETGDRITDNEEGIVSEYNALASGARDSMILNDNELETLKQARPAFKETPNLKITKTNDGENFITVTPEAEERVKEAVKDFEPVEIPVAPKPEVKDERVPESLEAGVKAAAAPVIAQFDAKKNELIYDGIQRFSDKNQLNAPDVAKAADAILKMGRLPAGESARLSRELDKYYGDNPLEQAGFSPAEDSVIEFDESIKEEEGQDDLEENQLFRQAAANAVSNARAIFNKNVLRETPLDKFQELGFSSKQAMYKAKDLATKSKLYGGEGGKDVRKNMISFGKVDRETGEVLSEHYMYLPTALAELNKSKWRFSTTASERSFDSRMIDLVSELTGYLGDKGFTIFKFPDAKDNETHIAFRPAGRGGKPVMTMAELAQRKRVKYSDTQFIDERHEQELLDAGIKLDKAIDRATELLQKIERGSSDHYLQQAFDSAETQVQLLSEQYDDLVDRQKAEKAEFEANIAAEADVEARGERGLAAERPAPETSAPRTQRAIDSRPLKRAKPSFNDNVEKAINRIASSIDTEVNVSFNGGMDSVARVTIKDGTATVHINPNRLKRIRQRSPESVRYILAHEVGHAFTAETMHHLDEKVLEGLHAAFRKARAKKPAGHPYRKQKGVGFDEWLADQFAIYQTQPKGSNTFFSRIARALSKIVDEIAPIFGVERLSPSRSGQAFMRSMFEAGVKLENPSNSDFLNSLQRMNLEFGGNRPASRAEDKRYFVELKALGREQGDKKESSYPRDFTVGQALNEASDWGRTALNAMSQHGKSMLTDPEYIPTKASQLLNSLRKGAPMLFTVANELKHIKGGRAVANSYRYIFDKVTADLSVFGKQVDDIFDNLDSTELQAFLEGKADTPQPIKKVLTTFYNKISKNLPTLGFQSDYFPRVYDKEAIEQNPEGFQRMLVEAAAKKGMAFFGIENAENAMNSILKSDSAFGAEIEHLVDIHGNNPAHNNVRVLDFIDDKTLRSNGFLRKDADSVIKEYMHRMLRRSYYEKEFSSYRDIGSDDSESMFETLPKYLATLPLTSKDGRLMSYEELSGILGTGANVGFSGEGLRLYNQAKAKGWVREDKDSDGAITYQVYDKNFHLRNTFNRIEDESDKHRFLTAVEAIEGRLGADKLSPKVRDAMSTAMAYQNWLTLMFSGFSQLIELSGIVFRNRDLEGAFDSLKAMKDLVLGEDAATRRALMNDLGFVQRQMTTQSVLEAAGINYQSPTAQKMNEVLFKWNGMNAFVNMSRVAGGAVAERFIQRHARKAQEGNSRSIRYLKELGLTPEQASYANSAEYKPYSEFIRNGDVSSDSAKNSEAIQEAMFKFVDSAIVRPNATQRPAWGSDPRWMLLWHLKSFMYAYGSTILGGLGKEISTRYNESLSKGKTAAIADATVPLMVYAIPLLMMSGLALELREFIQYTALGFGSTPPSDRLEGSAYLMELISRGGMLGPLEMGYSISEDVVTSNRTSLMGWISPTTSHLETILEFDLDKTVSRSTPIISQNPALKDWVRGMLD